MKILIIGSLAQSLINFRKALLKTMISRGHQVIACAPDIPDKIKKELESFGVQCRIIAINRTGLNPLTDLKTLLMLIKLLRKENPDRILAYTVKPVLYSSLAAQITGINGMYSLITGLGYAFSSSSSLKQNTVSKIVNILYRQALKANAGVLFQNPDDLELFKSKKLLPEKSSTIIVNGSGVDLQHFRPVPLPKGPSFLLIARLIKDKGIREYVQAAKIVKKKYPNAKFTLAGWLDPTPSAICKQELKKWQRFGIVKYLGKLTDVRPAIANCSIYVLPSYREGTPRTVLEAMGMGRPIITTDAPGCRETVINGKNGFLVPIRSPQNLAEAMIKYIEHPEIMVKHGQASRKLAEKKYDVHKVNKVIRDFMGY